MVRVLANAGTRCDAVLVCGTWDRQDIPYFAGLGEPGDYCEYHNAGTPEAAIEELFDAGLRSGLFERGDFDLTPQKLPLYLLNPNPSPSTVRWLRLFANSKYLRIRFPEGEEAPKADTEGFTFEFVVKHRGGPTTAEEVIRWFRDT